MSDALKHNKDVRWTNESTAGEKLLDNTGQEGWKLVSEYQWNSRVSRYIFKRRIDNTWLPIIGAMGVALLALGMLLGAVVRRNQSEQHATFEDFEDGSPESSVSILPI